MGEVAADLPAMKAFADHAVGRHDELDQVRGALNAVHLPREAFGYIPGIGGRIHDAYEDFVTDCADVAASATDAVLSLAEAVRRAAEAYAATDQASADQLHATGAAHPGVK